MINKMIEFLNESNYAELRQMLDSMNIADIAVEYEQLETHDIIKLFRMLPKDKAADVFAYVNHDIQQDIIESIADKEIGDIINELFLDDAVDFIEEMPANVVKRVLANVKPDRRAMINKFMQYPEGSAGSIMTIEFTDLKGHQTITDAFAHIRRNGADKESIYTCYVTDNERRLIGFVSAKSLLLAEQGRKVSDIMESIVIHAHTHDDRETVVNNLIKYSFMAMPVVDNEERLVGIITYDDAFTVQEQEITEDFEKMAAMSPSEKPYLKTGVFRLSTHRIPWLLLLMIFATLTGELVAIFENSLAALPALVAFIPMLMNTGGNAGSQSTTLIIRGMALTEIKQSDVFRVLWTETRVSLLCGALLFVSTFVSVMVFGEGIILAITVCLAMLATIILSNVIGVFMTFGAKAIKLDPAVMAAPLVTNVVDAMALIVYLFLAKAILHI